MLESSIGLSIQLVEICIKYSIADIEISCFHVLSKYHSTRSRVSYKGLVINSYIAKLGTRQHLRPTWYTEIQNIVDVPHISSELEDIEGYTAKGPQKASNKKIVIQRCNILLRQNSTSAKYRKSISNN